MPNTKEKEIRADFIKFMEDYNVNSAGVEDIYNWWLAQREADFRAIEEGIEKERNTDYLELMERVIDVSAYQDGLDKALQIIKERDMKIKKPQL